MSGRYGPESVTAFAWIEWNRSRGFGGIFQRNAHLTKGTGPNHPVPCSEPLGVDPGFWVTVPWSGEQGSRTAGEQVAVAWCPLAVDRFVSALMHGTIGERDKLCERKPKDHPLRSPPTTRTCSKETVRCGCLAELHS